MQKILGHGQKVELTPGQVRGHETSRKQIRGHYNLGAYNMSDVANIK